MLSSCHSIPIECPYIRLTLFSSSATFSGACPEFLGFDYRILRIPVSHLMPCIRASCVWFVFRICPYYTNGCAYIKVFSPEWKTTFSPSRLSHLGSFLTRAGFSHPRRLKSLVLRAIRLWINPLLERASALPYYRVLYLLEHMPKFYCFGISCFW